MARQWTEAETAAFPQVDAELQERGLDMYGQNDNGPTLVHYFEANPSIPALLPQFHAAVSVLRDKLVWRSPAWKEYDQLSRGSARSGARKTGRPGS